jgi:shikimate dehydrogenase
MKKYTGIIGNPLGHSISPVFQKAAFDFHNLDIVYKAWKTEEIGLSNRIDQLRELKVLGFNVTVPFKESIMEYLDDIDITAKSIGAVNTVVNNNNQLIGFNTDAEGFLKALEKNGSFKCYGKNILIIGAGGSARSVFSTLLTESPKSITIANRSVDKANKLLIGKTIKNIEIDILNLDGLNSIEYSHQFDPDLIINCTPMGMKYTDNEGLSPINERIIPRQCLVYDLVYNPEETQLLKLAKKNGNKTLGGLPMLIYQGAASFKLWTGKCPPIEIMFNKAKNALSLNNN